MSFSRFVKSLSGKRGKVFLFNAEVFRHLYIPFIEGVGPNGKEFIDSMASVATG